MRAWVELPPEGMVALIIANSQAYAVHLIPRTLADDSEAIGGYMGHCLTELDATLSRLTEKARDRPIQFIPGSPEAAEYLGTDYWIDNDGERHPYVQGTIQ